VSSDAARFRVKRAGGEEAFDSLSVVLEERREPLLDEAGDILAGDLGRSLARVVEAVVIGPSVMAQNSEERWGRIR
jgi:hypothetical protein